MMMKQAELIDESEAQQQRLEEQQSRPRFMASNNAIFLVLVFIATLESYRTFSPRNNANAATNVAKQIVYVEKRNVAPSLEKYRKVIQDGGVVVVKTDDDRDDEEETDESTFAMKQTKERASPPQVQQHASGSGSVTLKQPRSTTTLLSGKKPAPLTPKITDIKTPDKLKQAIQNHSPDREIVFVHVGKAGGVAVRQNIAAQCWDIYPDRNGAGGKTRQQNAAARNKCLAKYKWEEKIANQTRRVVHMWDMPPAVVQNATTYMFTLRNPMDRVISSYRFTHPGNCRKDLKAPEQNFGCWLLDHDKFVEGTKVYQVFAECFPNPAMEDFAQAVLPPFAPNHLSNLTNAEKTACRKIARSMVQGEPNSKVERHMEYNYNYYATRTIYKYPDRELFVLRTEHEFDDMVQLDLAMGGRGKFRHFDNHFSHGSEHYVPSPLTTEAYEKLCCVLEKEIKVYMDLFTKALNLDMEDRWEELQSLKSKCGIQGDMKEWREACQQRLQLSMEEA